MRVLAKAYGNRPLDRETTGENERVIYLVDLSTKRATLEEGDGVGFPKESVFRFDEELFQQLALAWKAGDQQVLAELWKRAIPVGQDADD